MEETMLDVAVAVRTPVRQEIPARNPVPDLPERELAERRPADESVDRRVV
jgi:hypothetical protein